jgi:hypothetical protein
MISSSKQLRAGVVLAVLLCIQGTEEGAQVYVLSLYAGSRAVYHLLATSATVSVRPCMYRGTMSLPPVLSDPYCAAPGCQAYPELFAAKHAKTSCIDHPSQFQRYGAHGRVIIDT